MAELIIEGGIVGAAEAIKRNFGWIGCFVVLAIPALVICVGVVAYLTST